MELLMLRKIPLFAGLNDDEMQKVISSGYTKVYTKEEVIIMHGDEGDAMYLILAGNVKLTLFNEDGKTIVLSVLKEGDFMGELSLLDRKARSCSVIAMSECRLFILTRTLFYKLISEQPKIIFNILKEMTERLRKADAKIGSLALLDVYGRIVQVLYDIASDIGEETEQGIIIDKLPTHEELAGIVGTTRESVTRVMINIRKTGIIRYRNDHKVILRNRIRKKDQVK